MTNFIAGRLAISGPTLFIIITLSFFLMRAAPGGPFDADADLDPAILDNLRAVYGLDQPLFRQYTSFLSGLFQGDFGLSLSRPGQTVAELMSTAFPVSIKLGLTAIIFALLIGVGAGIWAALRQNSWVDYSVMAAIELKLSPGQRVIKATYTRTEKSLPIGCADVFIPTDLGVKITADDLQDNSSPTLIQDKGFQISGAHQLIGATLSDTETSTRLKMTVGSPLIRIRLLILDQNERPIEYLLAHYRADTYEHHAFLSSL